ncbi:LLM class flavin-dependent oxidoreductase [Sphingomonas sp.]|uniref:LLM class flavin-dependent oxidoreductase n=1 Tax=Sphingomonas sp. TaxID=28214 RepID=UPI003D6CC6D0
MELALMSLGDIMDDPVTGRRFSASERYRMTLDAAEVADRTGIQGYYIGEHHGIAYTFSSPAVVLAAIAQRTKRLRLGTSVALAANLDTLRMVEDYATVDVISNGRLELVTGRGNFFEKTYDLFGQSAAESPARFAEAMELACQLWPGKPVHWQGEFRPPITGQHLEPTPIQQDRLPFWVGGGSSPDTAKLAGRLGLNLMLPSAFGKPDKFVAVAEIYREAFAAAGHKHASRVGACWHGWVGKTDALARERYEPRYRGYHAFNMAMIKSVNDNPPAYLTSTFDYEFLSTHGPAIVGGPAKFADRLMLLSELVGADVNLIKMDMGGVGRDEYVEMVELLGTEVVPQLNTQSRPAIAVNA